MCEERARAQRIERNNKEVDEERPGRKGGGGDEGIVDGERGRETGRSRSRHAH